MHLLSPRCCSVARPIPVRKPNALPVDSDVYLLWRLGEKGQGVDKIYPPQIGNGSVHYALS